jgi:hypothetical protein
MENKKKNDLRMFEFGAGAQLPSFEEVINSKPYVFFGNDNLWPQHSIQMYNWSSIMRACANAVISGVIGKNMLIDGKEAIKMVNSTETIYDIFKKVAIDFVIHNGFSLNTIKRRDGEGIANLYHMDFSKLRSGRVDDFDYVKTYWYSADWTLVNKYKPVELESFSLAADAPSQVYYAFPYHPNQKYYPLPYWIGGRMATMLDIEMMNYELNYIQQGYFPSLFISLNNGAANEEERDMIYRHMEERFSSGNRAGSMILAFSDSKENEPTITPLQAANNADMFLALSDQVEQKILTSFNITNPLLVGIKTAGQLGNKNEMVEGYEHFIKSVIIPKQQYLIREFEKLLFFMDGQTHKITIEQNRLFEDETATGGMVNPLQNPQDTQVEI